MEPFRLTRQSATFIALMAGAALVVALAAPFGSIALGAVVPVIGGLGVVGYSIVRLGTGEPLRMMVGWPHMDPSRVGVSTRSASYSDADTQQRLKDGLREAGIPFTVKMQDGKVVRSDGKDCIVWDQSGGDAVREFMESRGAAECQGKVAAGKPESGRC